MSADLNGGLNLEESLASVESEKKAGVLDFEGGVEAAKEGRELIKVILPSPRTCFFPLRLGEFSRFG